ncbi:MAG: ATP-binding cassette domain-containing protein [Acidimicrobiales bacterium]
MTSDLQRLGRWIRRAQPPRAALVRALALGLVASATNVALFVGAIALLVESATRPGLRAVAIILIIIELFAFLRSPLRFNERLSTHRLGYAAVTHWRKWLVLVVGQWNFSTWQQYGSGDLLERALVDTDELQDLWLRFVVPFFNTCSVMLIGDLVVAVLPPTGHWWPFAVVLFLVQLCSVVVLSLTAQREVGADRSLRHARGHYRAQLIELAAVAPEFALLHRQELIQTRTANTLDQLESAERLLRRQRRISNFVVIVGSLFSLASTSLHPHSSPVWIVVGAAVALATYEALGTIRLTLQSAIEVSGGGERLESLDRGARDATRPWPAEYSLRLDNVSVEENGRALVAGASFVIAPGSRVAIVGDSGVGKSTLLRVLAALDEPTSGEVYVGDELLSAINEDEIRQHLSYVVSEPGLTRGFAMDVLTLGRSTNRQPLVDLEALGLVADRSTRFEELSRGERARVALVRALVTCPDIYVLDEPTAGLGREETSRVLSLLGSTTATVLVATHDSDVISWCDDTFELSDGRLERLSR